MPRFVRLAAHGRFGGIRRFGTNRGLDFRGLKTEGIQVVRIRRIDTLFGQLQIDVEVECFVIYFPELSVSGQIEIIVS